MCIRDSSTPPRLRRARPLSLARSVGVRTLSPWPRRPRSRTFSCWTCEKWNRATSVSPQDESTERSVRERCAMQGAAGARRCGIAWPFWRAEYTLTWFNAAPQNSAPGSSAVAAVPAMWAGLACQTGRKKSIITVLTPARRNETASTAHWWS